MGIHFRALGTERKYFKYQNSIKMKEIEALQNAGNNVGLVIHEKYQEDKRRTVNKYFATLDGISISPVLDYENLNYFILGYIKASTIINKQINSVC